LPQQENYCPGPRLAYSSVEKRKNHFRRKAERLSLSQGTKAAMHRKHRSIERQCRYQLALTGQKETRQELEKMEREYRALAEWLERQLPAEQTPPSEA
jgi:hypothetical protein